MDGNGGITVKIAYVVGIAGGSASGKSTFSEQLKQGLAGLTVSVLSMDAYYRDSEERQRRQSLALFIKMTTIRMPLIWRK